MIQTKRCEVTYLYDDCTEDDAPTGEVYIFFINDGFDEEDEDLDEDYYFDFVVKCDCELAYKTMVECLYTYGFPVCDENNQYESLLEQPTVKEFIKRMGCTPYPMVQKPGIEYQYYSDSLEKGDIKHIYKKLHQTI